MRASLLFAGVFALTTLAGAAKADNIVSNPDFTSTNYAFPGYAGDPSSTNNQIAGWTGTGSYGATMYNVGGFYNNGTLPAGDNSVGFIQVSGTLSTTLTGLVAGQMYELSFLENSRSADGDGCCNAVPEVSVSLDGLSLLSAMADPAVGGSNPFRDISTDFTATGSSQVLTFAAETGGADGTATFSDVTVTAATPEPSSVALLGTGLMASLGALRRRRSIA